MADEFKLFPAPIFGDGFVNLNLPIQLGLLIGDDTDFPDGIADEFLVSFVYPGRAIFDAG